MLLMSLLMLLIPFYVAYVKYCCKCFGYCVVIVIVVVVVVYITILNDLNDSIVCGQNFIRQRLLLFASSPIRQFASSAVYRPVVKMLISWLTRRWPGDMLSIHNVLANFQILSHIPLR